MLLKSILSSFSRLSLRPQLIPAKFAFPQQSTASFSLNAPKLDLMEFFDDKKNWSESTKVKHGRPWRLEELRLKSNVDLHKLWYVLHKERNMLLTMEDFYINKDRPMPSHDRIAKVRFWLLFLFFLLRYNLNIIKIVKNFFFYCYYY